MKHGIESERILVLLSGVTESKREFEECKTGLEELGMSIIPQAIPRMTSYSVTQDKDLSIGEIKNQPRLFTIAQLAADAIIDRALNSSEVT